MRRSLMACSPMGPGNCAQRLLLSQKLTELKDKSIETGKLMSTQNKLIALTDFEKKLILQLQVKYPLFSANQFILAAIRYYAPKALQGVDGNLFPLMEGAIADILQDHVSQRSDGTNEANVDRRASGQSIEDNSSNGASFL